VKTFLTIGLLLSSLLISQEIQPIEIPLIGEAANRDLEMSSLAWYGDKLILMPQYVQEDSPAFYYLTRGELMDWVEGTHRDSLNPRRINLIAPDLKSQIDGYQGFEALCFQADTVFLLVEAKYKGIMTGYLFRGIVEPDSNRLKILAKRTVLKPPVNIKNMSFESLTIVGDQLMAIYEANGTNVNPVHRARLFDFQLNPVEKRPFPVVEYRITDVTSLDSENRFWAINFFWPGERDRLNPAPDRIQAAYPPGTTHQQFEHVERLLEFQLRGGVIEFTNTPPVQLMLKKGSRNWEGVARLDQRGFLLITDEYPRTILAFVPYAR